MASPQDGGKYPVAVEGSLQKEGSTTAPHTQSYPLNHGKVSLALARYSWGPGLLALVPGDLGEGKEVPVIATGPVHGGEHFTYLSVFYS